MFLASRKIIESVDHAWYWLGGISLVLFIGIMGCLVGFAIRYHRSRHPKAEHIPGSFKLEIAWTILPTLLSVWLFFLGLEGFQLMRNPPPGAYEISVEARQWAWTFTYPNEDVSSSELYVPVDTPIKLNLSSPIGDVLHSLSIPASSTGGASRVRTLDVVTSPSSNTDASSSNTDSVHVKSPSSAIKSRLYSANTSAASDAK